MDEAGVMGLTMPFGGTVTVSRRERESSMMCHICNMVPLVHFGG